MYIIAQNQFRAQGTAAVNADRVGGFGDGDFGRGARRLCRPCQRQRVVAAAGRRDTGGALIRRQGLHRQQVAACLERSGLLEQLQLHHRSGAFRQKFFQPRLAQFQHRGADDLPRDLGLRGFDSVKGDVGHLAVPGSVLHTVLVYPFKAVFAKEIALGLN